MKSSFVAVALSLLAGAALATSADASTAMLDDRQMRAVHILHQNKHALGLTQAETEKFDEFMAGMRKRTPDGLEGSPAGTAPPTATPSDVPKPGGLLGGALLPGIL